MSTPFSMTRDINGYNGFGLVFSDQIYSGILAENAAQTITIPSNFPLWLAVFSFTPGANIFVANNQAAVVPTGAIALAAAELNPVARQVKAGDVLSLITSDANSPELSVALYTLYTL